MKKEEIEALNDSLIWWQNRANASERDKKELQQRIDKAIEYIKELTDDNESVELMDISFYVKGELLNILQGSDKE